MKLTQIVKSDQRTSLHQPGGTITEFLSPLSEDAYSVMTGMIPPGASVPLHSHEDAESFYLLSGEPEALVQTVDGLQWQTLKPGDFIHIPGGVKHAWRNSSAKAASTLITCTAKLGRALEEMGQVIGEYGMQTLSAEAIQRLMEISVRYGYWLGNPEENAAVGIELV
jgi:quercetin dioxygenase-like cupin family protein